jgi:apolipoprotein N-acyltransferase
MILSRARLLLPQASILLAGAVSALGFAPRDIWPLPFLALAALIHHAQRAPRVRAAFLAGWCFAFGQFLVSLNWIATAFTHQDSMPAWIGWLGVVLLSAYLALFTGLAAGLAWRLSRGQRLAFVWLFAAAWMVCEWVRSGLFGGFAWNPLAVLWVPLPFIAQGAKWIGTYGMSGLLVLVSGFLWLPMQHRWRATAALAVTLIIVGTWLGRPSAAPRLPTTGLPVRVVQPNISQDEKYDPGQTEANIQRYLNLSGPRPAAPRVLLWPEGATLGFLEHETAIRAQLARLLGPHDILLTGGASILLSADGDVAALHNSVFAIDSAGEVAWRYDKAHLVPFGEFLPARPFLVHLGLSRLVPSEADFNPGPGPRTFVLGDFEAGGKPVTVGVQICYEIIFSGRVVDDQHRPSFLFNPSNDAWFGAWGPPQHLAQAQLRAIEEGIPVIRATPNGISALISPTGQLLATVPHHLAGTIDMHVPEPLPPTLFSRIGLWTSVLFGSLLAAAGILASRARGDRIPATAPLPERPPA